MLIQVLIKDPEIVSKTWMLELPDSSTIAELVGRFLLRRGGGHLSQPCLLRVMYGNQTLTNDLDRLVSDVNLPARGALVQTMWSVSAGHASSKCKECIRISELVGVSVKPLVPVVPVTTDAETPPKGKLMRENVRKIMNKHKIGTEEEKPRNNKNANATIQQNLELPPSQLPTSQLPPSQLTQRGVEVMKSLERMVSTCINASDVVDQLERLAKMHRSDELTDQEFIKAKAKLLE